MRITVFLVLVAACVFAVVYSGDGIGDDDDTDGDVNDNGGEVARAWDDTTIWR